MELEEALMVDYFQKELQIELELEKAVQVELEQTIEQLTSLVAEIKSDLDVVKLVKYLSVSKNHY